MAKDKEIIEQELPEVDIVGKAPKREIVTPTEGKVEAPGQIAPVPVYTTPVEIQPRVEASAPRHQRDVNFGEGLAKVASLMGMGQGDGGRDRVAAREQRAADRRERQDARQDARQARQEVRDARQDARQAVRDERQALRDARVAENRENRLNAQQVRRDARDVARMEREQSRLGAQQVRDAARQVRQEERDAAHQVRVDDRLARRDARVQSRLDRADERDARRQEIADNKEIARDARVRAREERMEARDARVAAARDERVANREEREASRLVRREEASKERAARVEEIARRRGAREAARVEAENTRDANREARRTERANDRAARQERVDANRAAREDARVERQEVRDERREARVADRRTARQERVDARADRREARQGERASRAEENVGLLTGKPQGLRRLDAPTTDAPTEVAAPADKAPAAKTYGVTTIEEPNVTRRPSGEGGTTAEQREITDAEAREMRGYTGGESAAANGQGAERKVTYIEEPNVQRRPVANEETVTEDKPISDEEARKIRGYGDGVAPESEGGYEDPYKDAYEYKQKPSNEIDYSDNAKRAEMERAHQEWLESDPYRNSDEFKVQLADDITAKPAGSTAGTETTEEGDGVTTTEGGGTITTTEGGGEPQGGNGTTTTEGGNGTEGGDQGGDDGSKLSDAEWYKKYFGIDEEEIARQKKAAKWAVAAQMLADSIGALSNVYWTGKGADAMKFEPGAPKAAAAANKMYADIREAREKALKAAQDERKEQFARKMAEANLAFEKQKHADDQVIKLGNLEINRQKLADDKEYQIKMLDLRTRELMQQGEKADVANKIALAELGLKQGQLALSQAELAARVDGSYYADTQGVPKKQQFSVGGKTVSFDNFSEAQMYQIYNALPEEVKEKVGKGKFTYDKYGNLIGDPNGTPEAKDILHAIHANTDNPNVARAIAQAAGNQAMIDAYDKVISDKAAADAAAAERKSSLIAEANKVVGVVDDDALKAAIKSGDEDKIQAEMDRVKAGTKYQRRAGSNTDATTGVVQSTGTKEIGGF